MLGDIAEEDARVYADSRTTVLVTAVSVANFFFVTVVLLNLLIAMLSSTYDAILQARAPRPRPPRSDRVLPSLTGRVKTLPSGRVKILPERVFNGFRSGSRMHASFASRAASHGKRACSAGLG
jgi:hypothetical protein